MNRFAPYLFYDCLMIDFSVDHHLRSLTIVSEAYLLVDATQPDGPVHPDPVRLTVTIRRPRQLEMTMNGDLWDDLEHPYDVDGNDMRGNEVYAMSTQPAQEPRSPNAETILVRSDGVKMSAISADITITHTALR